MAGAFSIGSALPYLNSVSTAIGVAKNLYSIIDRVPKIDSYSTNGLKPKKVTGKIEVRGVDFRYPARPETQVSRRTNQSNNDIIFSSYRRRFSGAQKFELDNRTGSDYSTGGFERCWKKYHCRFTLAVLRPRSRTGKYRRLLFRRLLT